MHFHLCFLFKYYFVFVFVSNRDMSSLFSSFLITLKVPLLISQNYYCLMLSYGLVKHLVHFFFISLFDPVLSFFDFMHSLDIISVVNAKYLLVFII